MKESIAMSESHQTQQGQSNQHGRRSQAVNDVAAAGRKVWLAALGAVATVGEDAAATFRTLVERGRAREAVAGTAPVTRALDELDRFAGEVQRKVQTAVEDGAGRALHRLGLPSRDEIQQLTARVEQLHAKLESLHSAKVN
jgi:poly(hydroxyalkanoate) granule-associated protein